jgi:general secretion pathway protein J
LRRADRQAGFTLIEAMAAIALMGAIVAAMALMTGQWLPSWRHGFSNLQRVSLIGQGLDRLAADFAAAEYVSLDGRSVAPVFEGRPEAALIVRSSLGPNAASGLEFVRLAAVTDAKGVAMVRTAAPFRPGDANPAFAGPVVLARAPFRIAFAYAGPDREWQESWPQGGALPSAVRITVRDAATGIVLSASTATLLHVSAPAPTPTPSPAKPAPGKNGGSADK